VLRESTNLEHHFYRVVHDGSTPKLKGVTSHFAWIIS
jgi:hypothetical protein